jgi:hypothetical protein
MNEKNHPKKSFPELNVDTRILYERLIKISIGGFVAYQELTDLIGRNVQEEARGLLTSARRKALNENQMLFGTITGKGLKRLDDAGKISTGESALAHIRRAARIAAKKVMSVDDFNKLPNAEKIRHNTVVSMLGVFDGMTTHKSIEMLKNKIEQAQDKLSMVKTLELFTQK